MGGVCTLAYLSPTLIPVTTEQELNRVSNEGQDLISKLLTGGVEEYVAAKHDALVADINAMYTEIGRTGKAPADVIKRVEASLKDRLSKAQSASFFPTLSYSELAFALTNNKLVSPWGQASSLLADIAAYPRKALTEAFFFSGLKVSGDDVIDAMNVAGDVLCRDRFTRGIRERSKAELELIAKIENASIQSRERCNLLYRILSGDPIDLIDAALPKDEAAR